MKEYQFVKGSPASMEGRLPKEVRCYELLDNLGIDYDRIDHEGFDTMEACYEVNQLFQGVVCKNLFLTNRKHTKFYLLMMPGDKSYKSKELSQQLKCQRLSFANEKYMEEYLDILPGSVSFLGLMNDKNNMVQLLVDEDVLKEEYIGLHPCINTSSLRMRTKDLFGVVLPAIHHDMIAVKLLGE